MTLHVQFDSPAETRIVSYFDSPQDSEVWPNIGEVVVDDARWIAYYNSLPAGVQAVLPAPAAPAEK